MAPWQALGKYYDGKTATGSEVMIGVTASSLRIACTDGTFEKTWSFDEIEIIEEAAPPQPAKLTSKKEPESRLYINPDGGWLRIKDKLPRRISEPKIRPAVIYFSIILILFVFLLIFSF